MSGEFQSCKRNIDKEPFLRSQIFYAVLCTFCRYEILLPVVINSDLELSWNRTMERYFRKISLWDRKKNIK